MLETVQIVLSTLIFITLLFSVVFSFRSRRKTDPKQRGTNAALMNISMGLMLILIAVTQLFFLSDTPVRRIFGTICLLLGLFNLFAGIRNYLYFSRMSR
ncbi:YtpI family protein [Paenibacillus chitinolyticus]|uniref:YtpI family protein n=1 Tax=Paenibacillus TaxID=44249 RepID=UPI001C46E008|nr:YtpI family protein [Paenibacillus chitinolyticus]MBV6714072.1 YtpI family protein [Paenibacillus chitinolyticus]